MFEIAGAFVFTASALLLMLFSIRSFKRGAASSFLTGGLSFYSVSLAIAASELCKQFSSDDYFLSGTIYLLGTLLLLATLFLGGTKKYSKHIQYDFQSKNLHVGICIILATLSLILFYWRRDDVLGTWVEARGEGGWPIVLATFFLLLAAPGIVSAFETKNKILGVILLGLCLVCFLISGSRAAMLGAVFFWAWNSLGRPRGIKARAGLVIFLMSGGFLAHTILRAMRGRGLGSFIEAIHDGEFFKFLIDFIGDNGLMGGESSISEYYVYATSVASADKYGMLTSVVRLFLIPFPSISGFIEKPMDVTYRLWENAFSDGLLSDAAGQEKLFESYTSGAFGSLHPTLFGELFLAGGIFSLIVSVPIIGLSCCFIDRYLLKAKPVATLLLVGPVLSGYMMIARGNSIVGFGYFFYLAVLVFLILLVVRAMKIVARIASNQPATRC